MDWTTGRDNPDYKRIAAPAHARAGPPSFEEMQRRQLERGSSNLGDLESHNQSGPSSPPPFTSQFERADSFTYYRRGWVSPPLRHHQLDRSVSPPLRRHQPAGFNSSRPSSPEYRHKFERAPTISIIDDLTNDNLSNKPEDGMDHPAGSVSPEDIITDDLTNDNVTEKPEGKIDHPAGSILPGDKLGDNSTDDNVSKKPEAGVDYSAGTILPGDKLGSDLANDDVSKKPEDIINKTKEKDDMPQTDDLEYTRASNVNVSNFVSVKLCGKSNYDMWKAQMKCLMRSHNMLGLIDEKKELPGKKNTELTKRYKNLLNGWLIGALNEEIIKDNRIFDKTAKDIWETLKKSYDPYTGSPTDSTPLEVRQKIKTREITGNSRLKKKLHTATLEGHWWKAKSILNNHEDAATLALSDNGDTLLHVAVREGNNYFLKKVLSIIDTGKQSIIETGKQSIIDTGKQIEKVNLEGHTALHIAAIVGNKDAARLLVEKRKELLQIEDNNSKIPLACAYLNKQVNAFVYLWKVTQRIPESLLPEKLKKDTKKDIVKEIGKSLQGIENEIGESLLHTAIFNKEYDLAKELVKIYPRLAKIPLTLVVLTRNFPSQIGFAETLMYPSLKDVSHKLVKRSSLLLHSLEYLYARAGGTLWEMRRFRNKYYSCLFPELVIALLVPAAVLYPIYQLLCLIMLLLFFPFSMLYYVSWKVLAFLVAPIEKIEMKRKEHKEAKNFLKWICNKNIWVANSSVDSSFDKFYRESLLEAVRLDVYEVLDQILELSSKVMDVKNKDGHNIIQLAVINRSQKVYNLISPIIEREGSYRRAKDIFNNNLLHLVGRLAPSAVLSLTTGAALQLQRELQWRQEVEKLMEPTQHADENVDYDTPEMVFSREHASLVKEGEKWMKTTAESCSITAALIITIVFAAAITVPGGSNQETGIPLFKRNFAFNIFAVADAISLFSASTSLLVFLSILTTRFAESDFLISLPRRLFIGLCLLFLSTTAMMLAFSTILFLVFCDERPWMLAPIGGLTCFPIAAIVTLQLPLVIDLYQATSIPIFGKEENEKITKEEENEEKMKTEEENEEKVKEEEERREFQKIHGDNNPLRKRRNCLPLHLRDVMSFSTLHGDLHQCT